MILFAFDVDGTLDTSGGPISFGLFATLSTYGLVHFLHVAIVSPSGAWPKGAFPHFDFAAPDGGRQANLERAKAAFPEDVVWIYISDNKDYDAAAAAGFAYIEAAEFAKGLPK